MTMFHLPAQRRQYAQLCSGAEAGTKKLSLCLVLLGGYDSAGAIMLRAATVTTKFFIRVVTLGNPCVLNVALRKMEATHTAIVMATLLISVTVAAFLIVAHHTS
ncbi:hypothetical protein [Haliea atlantica]